MGRIIRKERPDRGCPGCGRERGEWVEHGSFPPVIARTVLLANILRTTNLMPSIKLTILLAAALLTACTARDSRPKGAPAATIPVHDSASGAVAASQSAPPPAAHPASLATPSTPDNGTASTGPTAAMEPAPVVRALYVNRYAAQSRKRMAWLIGVADSTEINALVIDMKDEFGLNFKNNQPGVCQECGQPGQLYRS